MYKQTKMVTFFFSFFAGGVLDRFLRGGVAGSLRCGGETDRFRRCGLGERLLLGDLKKCTYNTTWSYCLSLKTLLLHKISFSFSPFYLKV